MLQTEILERCLTYRRAVQRNRRESPRRAVSGTRCTPRSEPSLPLPGTCHCSSTPVGPGTAFTTGAGGGGTFFRRDQVGRPAERTVLFDGNHLVAVRFACHHVTVEQQITVAELTTTPAGTPDQRLSPGDRRRALLAILTGGRTSRRNRRNPARSRTAPPPSSLAGRDQETRKRSPFCSTRRSAIGAGTSASGGTSAPFLPQAVRRQSMHQNAK